MLEGLIQLASYGFQSGGIGDFLVEVEQYGFFSYLLPFLLIFALVFGILSRIKLFNENRGVNGIIALVIGLMALQFDFVPKFFSEVFPRFGVALAILLIILIIAGLFLDPESNGVMYTMLGIGAIIIIVTLVNTAGSLGWSSGSWWYDNWKVIAGIVFILAALGIIIGGSRPPAGKSKSPLAQALLGK